MPVTVRTATPEPAATPTLPDEPRDDTGVDVEIANIEPLDLRESRSGDILLESLGLGDDIEALPAEAQESVDEIKQYVKDLMRQKGRSETVEAFQKTLNELKAYIGMDETADPDVVIERLGTLIKSYKSLAFVPDTKERRALFMKLARQQTAQDMDNLVYEEMTKRRIWQ